jgi:hypothetical protein
MARKKPAPPPAVSEYLREIGRKGGKAQTKTKGFGSMTPERRAEIAAAAAKARWGKGKTVRSAKVTKKKDASR